MRERLFIMFFIIIIVACQKQIELFLFITGPNAHRKELKNKDGNEEEEIPLRFRTRSRTRIRPDFSWIHGPVRPFFEGHRIFSGLRRHGSGPSGLQNPGLGFLNRPIFCDFYEIFQNLYRPGFFLDLLSGFKKFKIEFFLFSPPRC